MKCEHRLRPAACCLSSVSMCCASAGCSVMQSSSDHKATAARPPQPHRSEIPRHVAIIMDGNGRWAAQRGLPRLAGHQHGTDNIRRITTAAAQIGIEYLTLWAFSTENWRRPREEIDGILQFWPV